MIYYKHPPDWLNPIIFTEYTVNLICPTQLTGGPIYASATSVTDNLHIVSINQ